MFTVKLANHIIGIENHYPYTEKLCWDYFITIYDKQIPETIVRVSQAEIMAEQKEEEPMPLPYLESVALYRKICEYLLKESILLFSGCAMEIKENGYLFACESGKQKQEILQNLRTQLKEQATTLQENLPLLSVSKESVTAYGTPFCTPKELQKPTSVKVTAVFLLQEGKTTCTKKLSPQEAYPLLLDYIYRRQDVGGRLKTLDAAVDAAALPVYLITAPFAKESVDSILSLLQQNER